MGFLSFLLIIMNSGEEINSVPMICFLVWSWVIHQLGAVVATNWVYFNPITTIIFAWWLLHEQITLWFLLGSLLIIVGMILSDKK